MLTAIPADAASVHYAAVCQRQAENWPNLSLYEKYNTLVWELVSHLWFLLVLVVLTTVSLLIFSRVCAVTRATPSFASITLGKLSVLSSCCWVCLRRDEHLYRLSTD
jgi:glucan biosynthesis protein C